jgi:hypothetical protein
MGSIILVAYLSAVLLLDRQLVGLHKTFAHVSDFQVVVTECFQGITLWPFCYDKI